MQYACVFYGDEKLVEALGESELEAIVAGASAWVDELKRSGHYVLSAGLQSTRTATTLRKRDGVLSTTDGPFAETKEQLGGFTIIEARDLNEAIQVASKSPCMCLGCVEVRPMIGAQSERSNPLDQKVAMAFAANSR